MRCLIMQPEFRKHINKSVMDFKPLPPFNFFLNSKCEMRFFVGQTLTFAANFEDGYGIKKPKIFTDSGFQPVFSCVLFPCVFAGFH